MYQSQYESPHQESDFGEHNNPTAIAYDIQQSRDKIKAALCDMGIEGFDFKYKIWNFQQLGQYEQCTKFRHRSYLRHQCWRCYETTNSQMKKLKRFTTSKGTAQVRFKFMKLKKFLAKYPDFKKKKQSIQQQVKGLKYPYIFLWDFYIYHMKCKTCMSQRGYSHRQTSQNPQLVYATPFIYKGILQQMIDELKQIIIKKLNPSYQKKIKIRRKGPRVPPLRKHKSNLCEACAKGICDNYKSDVREDDGYDSNSFLDSSSSSRQSSQRSSQRPNQNSSRRSSQRRSNRSNQNSQSSHNSSSCNDKDGSNINNSHLSNLDSRNSAAQSPRNAINSIHSHNESSKNSSNEINSQNKDKFIEKVAKKSMINLEGQLLFAQKTQFKKQKKQKKNRNQNLKYRQQDQLSQKSSQSLQSVKSSGSYRSSISNKSNKSANTQNIYSYSNSVASQNNKKQKKSQKSEKSIASERKYVQKVVNKGFIQKNKVNYIQRDKQMKRVSYIEKDNYSIKSEPSRKRK